MSPDHSLDHSLDHRPDHRPEHRRILERVLRGELEPEAPEVQSLAADCPLCAAELAELRQLVQLLDETGRERREILGQAPASDPDPIVRQTVEGLLAGESPCLPPHAGASRSGPFSRLLIGLVTAAAVLFLAQQAGLFGGRDVELPRGPDRVLGGGPAVQELLQPRGAGAEFSRFSWRGSLPAHGWYVVRVWNLDAPAEEALESPQLELPSWYPGPAWTTLLPERLGWSVTAYDGVGVEIGQLEAEASR